MWKLPKHNTVTATFSRLYGRILKDFIEEEIRMRESEEQSGFRAGRSRMNNIFCLKQVVEKELEVGNQIHVLFIDLKKVCDNLNSQNYEMYWMIWT